MCRCCAGGDLGGRVESAFSMARVPPLRGRWMLRPFRRTGVSVPKPCFGTSGMSSKARRSNPPVSFAGAGAWKLPRVLMIPSLTSRYVLYWPESKGVRSLARGCLTSVYLWRSELSRGVIRKGVHVSVASLLSRPSRKREHGPRFRQVRKPADRPRRCAPFPRLEDGAKSMCGNSG